MNCKLIFFTSFNYSSFRPRCGVLQSDCRCWWLWANLSQNDWKSL